MENNCVELAFLAFIALVFSYVFYRFFESKWPEHYFSPDDNVSIFISLSPIGYLIFRFLPISIIFALVFSVSKSLSLEDRIALGFVSGFLHGIFTNGLSLLKIVTRDNTVKIYFNKLLQIGSNIFTFVIVVLAGAAGGYLSSFALIQGLSPTYQGVIDNLWSSFVAIAIFFSLQKTVSMVKKKPTTDIYGRSYESISADLIQYVREISDRYNADEKFVTAICVVENLQRPKWFREFEKVAWFFFRRPGTYGIVQAQNNKYLSDKESIEVAVSRELKDTKGKDLSMLHDVALQYNGDPKYADIVMEAYSYLNPPS